MTETTFHTPTHADVLRDILVPPFSEADALGWMVILHTHRIRLRAKGGARQITLDPLTQRGAADVIAAIWPDRNDERSEYTYWYWQFNTQTPYEVLESAPPESLPALQEKLVRLRQAPLVESVAEGE